MNFENLKDEFINIYKGEKGDLLEFFAPGRVNLIGEHTDYNGGFVFPCALSFGTSAVVRKRADNIINFASTNFDKKVSANLSKMEFDPLDDWANYLKGIVVEFQERNITLGGLDILISGEIPNGAGLSSSASIELLMSVILNKIFNAKLDMIEMVKLSQHSENNYIGLSCGIMDQFAIGMGKKDNAMFLNCTTLDFEYVPVILKDEKIVIANTNKRRGLADSKYNERCDECARAVEFLNEKLNIKLLGELTPEVFEENKYLIKDETVLKRATHVIYEIDRTVKAVELLKSGDIDGFGKLLNQSHSSLRDLYEVTGIELDTLAQEAQKIKGCLGSRMTGAGFGGCTISIVQESEINNFIKTVGENYKNIIGYEPTFYVAQVGDGARLIQ